MIGSSLLNKVSFGRFGSVKEAPKDEKTQETLKSMGELNARVNASKNTTFDITEVKYQAGNNSVMAKTPQEALKADFALSYSADQSAPTQDNLDILKVLEDKGYGDAEVIINKPGSDDTNTTIAELIADTDGNAHNPVTTETIPKEVPTSAAAVSDDGVFKMSSIEDLKNLSQAEQDSIKTLDIQGNIIEFEAALANNEITVPKGIEKFKFTLTGDENQIDNMKSALDMTAHHMSNQLSAEGIGRAGQQVKFIADFKDIQFSVAFAKAHPSIIGTTDAAKTLRAKMGEHPETRRKTTENIDEILDKALAEVETVTSPTELDYVIPGSIYEKEFTGRDNYAQVIDTLSNQMGNSTKEKAAELKSMIDSRSRVDEVDHSDVTLVEDDKSTTAEASTVTSLPDDSDVIPEGIVDDTSVAVEEPAIIAEASEAEETTTLSPEEALETLKTDRNIEAYVQATGEKVKDQLEEVPELASLILSITAEATEGSSKARLTSLAEAARPESADREARVDALIKEFVSTRNISMKAMKEADDLASLKEGLKEKSSISYNEFVSAFLLKGAKGLNKTELRQVLDTVLPSAKEFIEINDRYLEKRMAKVKRDAQKADVQLKVSHPIHIADTLAEASKAEGKVSLDLSEISPSQLDRNNAFAQFLINNHNGGNLTIVLPSDFHLDPKLAQIKTVGPQGLSQATEALEEFGVYAPAKKS